MEEDNEINNNRWRISKERRRKRPTEKDRRRARRKLIKILDEEKDRRRARRKMIKWVKEINEKERIRGVEIGRKFFKALRTRMKKIRKRNINVMRRITEWTEKWTERKRRSERRRSERKRRRREERERMDRGIKMGIFRRRLGIDSVAVAFPILVVYWIVWVIFFWINERAQLWTVFVFL